MTAAIKLFTVKNFIFTEKTCPVLQPPIYDAITSLSCGWSFGSQASFSCNLGYRLAGSSVRICEANGRWSGTTTTVTKYKLQYQQ